MSIIESICEAIELVRLQVRFTERVPNAATQRQLLKRLHEIGRNVQCAHNASHAMAFILDILSIPSNLPGCIVEAGCFKGGSTAKFSIFAKLSGRQLIVFDSFEGLPRNEEEHERSTLGHSIRDWFKEGAFAGTLQEVKANVGKYGELEVCEFIEGWFEQTMPEFNRPIAAAYLDVDLASSTRTCLKYLYPRLIPGGVICSQDGDFPLVIEVFNDDEFWEKEVGCIKPEFEGLGKKITHIRKPLTSAS